MQPKTTFKLIYLDSFPLLYDEVIETGKIQARYEEIQTRTPNPQKNLHIVLEILPNFLVMKNGSWWSDESEDVIPSEDVFETHSFDKNDRKIAIEIASARKRQRRILLFKCKTPLERDILTAQLKRYVLTRTHHMPGGKVSQGLVETTRYRSTPEAQLRRQTPQIFDQRRRSHGGSNVTFHEIYPTCRQFAVNYNGRFSLTEEEKVDEVVLAQKLLPGGEWVMDDATSTPDILEIDINGAKLQNEQWIVHGQMDKQLPHELIKNVHKVAGNERDFAIETVRDENQQHLLYTFTASSSDDLHLIVAMLKRRQIIRRKSLQQQENDVDEKTEPVRRYTTDAEVFEKYRPSVDYRAAPQEEPEQSGVFEFPETESEKSEEVVEPKVITTPPVSEESVTSRGEHVQIDRVYVIPVDKSEKLNADKINQHFQDYLENEGPGTATLRFSDNEICLRPKSWWPAQSCAAFLPAERIQAVYTLSDDKTLWAVDLLTEDRKGREVYILQAFEAADRNQLLSHLTQTDIKCLENSACGDSQNIFTKTVVYTEVATQTNGTSFPNKVVSQSETIADESRIYLGKKQDFRNGAELSNPTDTGYSSDKNQRNDLPKKESKRCKSLSMKYKQRPPPPAHAVDSTKASPSSMNRDRVNANPDASSDTAAQSTKLPTNRTRLRKQPLSLIIDDHTNHYTTLYFVPDLKISNKNVGADSIPLKLINSSSTVCSDLETPTKDAVYNNNNNNTNSKQCLTSVSDSLRPGASDVYSDTLISAHDVTWSIGN